MSFQLSKVLLLVMVLSLAAAVLAVLPSVLATSQGQTPVQGASPVCTSALASSYGPLLDCASRMGRGLHSPHWGSAGELLPGPHPVPAAGRADPGLHVEDEYVLVHDLALPAALAGALQ